jgi:hypothetical protein
MRYHHCDPWHGPGWHCGWGPGYDWDWGHGYDWGWDVPLGPRAAGPRARRPLVGRSSAVSQLERYLASLRQEVEAVEQEIHDLGAEAGEGGADKA